MEDMVARRQDPAFAMQFAVLDETLVARHSHARRETPDAMAIGQIRANLLRHPARNAAPLSPPARCCRARPTAARPMSRDRRMPEAHRSPIFRVGVALPYSRPDTPTGHGRDRHAGVIDQRILAGTAVLESSRPGPAATAATGGTESRMRTERNPDPLPFMVGAPPFSGDCAGIDPRPSTSLEHYRSTWIVSCGGEVVSAFPRGWKVSRIRAMAPHSPSTVRSAACGAAP